MPKAENTKPTISCVVCLLPGTKRQIEDANSTHFHRGPHLRWVEVWGSSPCVAEIDVQVNEADTQNATARAGTRSSSCPCPRSNGPFLPTQLGWLMVFGLVSFAANYQSEFFDHQFLFLAMSNIRITQNGLNPVPSLSHPCVRASSAAIFP